MLLPADFSLDEMFEYAQSVIKNIDVKQVLEHKEQEYDAKDGDVKRALEIKMDPDDN